MRSGYLIAGIGISIAACGRSACAVMTKPEAAVRCTVHGAQFLPPKVGGSAAVCKAFEQAARGTGAAVVVTILNAHAAVATASADGRAVPEQRIDVSDRTLDAHSFEMLAGAVARHLQAPDEDPAPAKP